MENKKDLVYRIIKDNFFNKLNKERKEHLSRHHGHGYATLCNLLGIEPEDKLLYEQGLVEKN